jgi:CRISPR system Cascade subunit CasA
VYIFDLRKEPWIPVRDIHGQLLEVSLQEALTNGQHYLRIESDNPLEVAALHRFLLAVLHRALKGPTTARDNARWLREGFPVSAIEDYLDRFHDRFDLFHPDYPFFQIADRPETLSKSNFESIAKIDIGLPSMHFDDSAYKNPPVVRPGQAARMLLSVNCFALSGGRGYYPGLVTTAILAIPLGQNLHETLCLNMVPYEEHKQTHDLPSWELKEGIGLEQIRANTVQQVRGLTHHYSWISRAIRLFPEELDGSIVLRTMFYASAFGKDRNAAIIDPMASYRINGEEGLSPVRFREGRGFWRDIYSLIPQSIEGAEKPPLTIKTALSTLMQLGVPHRNLRIHALILGQAGKLNEEKWFYWRQSVVNIPAYISENRTSYHLIKSALESAESVESSLGYALDAFAEHMLFQRILERRNKQQITAIKGFIRNLQTFEYYWSRLERHFYELLDALGETYDEDEVERRWKAWLYEAALEAWNLTVQGAGSTPRALKAAAQAQGKLLTRLKELKPELKKEVAIEKN